MSLCPYGLCDGSGTLLLDGVWVACKCGPLLHFNSIHEKAMPYRKVYWSATFDNYEPEVADQVAALAKAKEYAESWAPITNRGLAIWGRGRGHGKSHLAAAICNRLIERHWTKSLAEVDQNICLFINVSNWFGESYTFSQAHPTLTAEMRKSGAEDDPAVALQRKQLAELDERIKTTRLLVLDDLTVFPKEVVWRVGKLYDIVEYRAANGLPIIFTDNRAAWGEIETSLGGEVGVSVVDRLKRNCDVVVIGTPKKKGKKS